MQFSQKEKLTSHFHWFMTYSKLIGNGKSQAMFVAAHLNLLDIVILNNVTVPEKSHQILSNEWSDR